MPTVVVTPDKGQAIFITVEDKSEAIRVIAQRLRGYFNDSAIEHSLNVWLSGAMNTPLLLQADKEKMQLKYIP